MNGSAHEVLQNILTRRSIRKYTDRQVGDEDLATVLKAGQYAPSGGNSQSWLFTVLQDQRKLEQLNEYIRLAFARVEVDETTYKSIRSGKIAARNESYSFYYHAPTLVIVSNEADYGNAMADSACALENMLLAAQALNLGACWINQVRWFDRDPKVRKLLTELGIPEKHRICGSMSLGYRDGEIPAAPKRRENTVTIIK